MDIDFAAKAQSDLKDYDTHFAAWLDVGERLVDADAETDEPSLAVESLAINQDQDAVKVWLHGGKPGHSHRVTVLAKTNWGRVKQASFIMRVRMTP